MKKSILPFISLSIIACMLLAPILAAQEEPIIETTPFPEEPVADDGFIPGGDPNVIDDPGYGGDPIYVDDPSAGGDPNYIDNPLPGGELPYINDPVAGGDPAIKPGEPDTEIPEAPKEPETEEPGAGEPGTEPVPDDWSGTGDTPGTPGGTPEEADAEWQDLPDVTIYQGTKSGTILQENVYSKCKDRDNEFLIFNIETKSDNFNLYFVEDDLRIYDLKPAFTGEETITLTCNNIPESFLLRVIQRPTTPTPTPAQTADDDSDELKVHINTIYLPDSAQAGEQIPITILFENNGKKIENLKATVTIQELGIKASIGPMDVQAGKKVSSTIIADLPEDTESGTYYARININSGSYQRIKHREVEVTA